MAIATNGSSDPYRKKINRFMGGDGAYTDYKTSLVSGTNDLFQNLEFESDGNVFDEIDFNEAMPMIVKQAEKIDNSKYFQSSQHQKPSKEYWKKFKAVGSKGWSGVKSAGSGMVQGYKDYNEGRPKAKTGVGKIWQGFGNVVDSAVSLASVPLNLVGYTTRGLVDGTNRALEGGQYAVEHTGGTVGELGRGIGAALHRGTRWGREKAEGNLLEEIVRREAKHKPVIMHYPRNPYQLNLIALTFLLSSFISFTFSSSTTGSVVGAFSQTSMLPTFLGIIFLAASFALFQIKH